MKIAASALKGVIFDLDGVIVDSHPLHKRAWRSFLAYIGKEVSDSDLNFIFEGRRRREILIHFLGNLSDAEIQEYGIKKDNFFYQVSGEMEPVVGTVEFIKGLKQAHLPMGVATSASRQRAEWTLEKLEIADCFHILVTGDEVAKGKPDPAIYRLAAGRLSIRPEFLLAIEDSVSGVQSAKSAGLRCLGIASEERALLLMNAGADQVLANLCAVSLHNLNDYSFPSPSLL
jgi:beta-phosphoglucomutase